MAIPNQTLSILDPGLGLIEPGATVPLFLGTAQRGTVNEIVAVADKPKAIEIWGQGPLTEAVCHTIDVAGGPVLGLRLNGSVAGASGSVTATRTSTSTGTVAVSAGVAFDRYEAIVTIVTSGTLGTGEFQYSLDDGRTFSESITIPSGGSYSIANTNLQITFTAGDGPIYFETGDLFEFGTTAPYYTTTDLGNAFAAILDSAVGFDFVVLLGKPTNGAGGATMFAALATHLASLENTFRYVGGIMDAGNDTPTNVVSALAAVANPRVMVVYGDADMASSKPFVGYGTPKQSAVVPVAARAAASLISTDLGRFADGPLTGLVEISHDERKNEVLDQQKIATLRTFVGAPGFYITNGRLKSGLGSDFKYWQHRRLMDAACRTVVQAQYPFINAGVRTSPNGAIDARDAERFEAFVKDALRVTLTDPSNAEGTRGHVSAFNYTVDRTNNVQVSDTVLTAVAIRPLGYAKQLITTIGFATNVGGE